LERECFCDQPLQALIAFGEVFGGCGKVEGEGGGCLGHWGSIPETGKQVNKINPRGNVFFVDQGEATVC